MVFSGTQRINKCGHLEIGGCDVVDLAKEFGTPLYVLDEELIRKNCREYKDTFSKFYPKSKIIYAGKANLSIAICKLMDEENIGLDLSSGGEIWTAYKAKFPMHKVYFHGNNKSQVELKLALDLGIERIVVDNEYELELLDNLCKEKNIGQNILLRLTPGVKPNTHSYIQTGQIDSKFGISIENGEALRVVKKIRNLERLNLIGIHCHIGSQILELTPFKIATEIMLGFAVEAKDKFDLKILELNMGGGLGIRYTDEDLSPSISEYVKILSDTVLRICEKFALALPELIVEPGRSIIGTAGVTLYTVGSIKTIPNIRTYLAVDGGMTDNPRYALYKAKHNAIIANKAELLRDFLVSIAGKCCELGDMLIYDISIQKPDQGDILAVFSTGAYNYSMASNYNKNPRPATVLAKDGIAKIIIKRETYDDLIRNDIEDL